MTFNSSNWFTPFDVAIYARNDFAIEDPIDDDHAHGRPAHDRPLFYRAAAARIAERVDVTAIDDESAGVFVQQRDG